MEINNVILDYVAKGRINELEENAKEFTKNAQKNKDMKKQLENTKDRVKDFNICLIVLEEENRGNDEKLY